MNVLIITYNPGNYVSQVSQNHTQYKNCSVQMLDFGFKNMVTVVYMPTAPGRHTLATWISCHFLHLQIETQITYSGAPAYFCPILPRLP